MKAPSRALSTLAIGFVTLDAVLLVYSGLSLKRPWLAVGAGLCALAAVLVVVIAWRRYRRALAEIDQARREMRAEVESIRALLHGNNLHN